MPLDIDGAAVLRAVVNAPDVFKDIQNDLNAFAHKVVVKQLKTKGTDVSRLRDVYRAVGEDNFRLIIDGLSDAGKSLSVKIDKHNADLKTAGLDWLRMHLNELARGALEPTTKPSRVTKPKKQASGPKEKPKSPAKRAISVKAFEAKWDGVNRDE